MNKQKGKQKKSWNGIENISDKILLVESSKSEDSIKYCFLLKELQKNVKKLIFVTPKETIKILRFNNFDFEIYPIETDLNSLQYDFYIDILNLACSKDFVVPKKYLEVNPQEFRIFRANFICDHRRFNVGLSFTEIGFDLFKIFSKIREVNIYQLNKKGFKKIEEKNLQNKEIKDIDKLALAIKSLHLIISDDELIINLASALGMKVFALYKNIEQKNEKFKNIIPFVCKKSWEKTIPIVKDEIENFRISLRENYLLACIEKYECDATKDKVTILEAKTLFYSTLLRETFKEEYLKKYIDVNTQLIKILPSNLVHKANLAIFYGLHLLKKEEAAKIWTEILPKTNPEQHPDMFFNFACFSCSYEDFENYEKYYDYRFKKKTDPTSYPNFDKPQWKGEKDVSDKTLLVYHEQGFGDNFLFSRYLPYAKKLFKNVIYVVKKEIKDLIEFSFPEIEILSDKEFKQKNINFDYHCPIMSLGFCLKIRPYQYKKKKWLKINKQKKKEFKQYFLKDKFNIGIFWESGRTLPNRNTTLETLLPLAYLDNVQLYSLQIEKEDFEINYLDDNINIVNLGKHFKDFSDTAAAIENCDLIVTTDSSVMNLAGAMGKKTFALFNKTVEWRWYNLDGEDICWYKTIKPFRTKKNNDFSQEIEKICEEIKSLTKNDSKNK